MTYPKKTMICVALGDVYSQNTLFDTLPFALNSGKRMQELLTWEGWSLKVFYEEEKATKKAVEDALSEAIRDAADDEWLLFYFVGHGYRLFSAANPPVQQELLVTYDECWKNPQIPVVENCITDAVYSSFVCEFLEGKPDRHFISILDCCFSGGMINLIPAGANHTLFAAAAADAKAFAQKKGKLGSFFFNAINLLLPVCQNFTAFAAQLGTTMDSMKPKGLKINKPVIHLPPKFTTHYF